MASSSDAPNERESRFAHLLKPIRDLAQNWDINIAQDLENYLSQLEGISIAFEDGQRLNFAEAATLIQGSTCVYSRKVEYLYELVWKTLDEVHLLSKSRKGRKQRSSVKDGVDQDALELADAELLLLDEVIIDGGDAVDMREAHEDYAALAAAASASRHGSTPGPATRIAGRAAAATSADLMAKTPLSRMGSARSDAGAASAFRLGACAVDDGTGALMLGGQGGVGLLGTAGAGLGLGGQGAGADAGGAHSGDYGAGAGAGAGARGLNESGVGVGGGFVGALSFMDGSMAMAPSPSGTASTRQGEAGDFVGGFGDDDGGAGGGVGDDGDDGYGSADGGWFGPSAQAQAQGGRAARRKPRGLVALWAAGPYGEGEAGTGQEQEQGQEDDPWLALDIHDSMDMVLTEAKAAGMKRLVRGGISRPMRSAKTFSKPLSCSALAATGADRAGGVVLSSKAVEALTKAGAISLAGSMATGDASIAVPNSSTTEAAFTMGAMRAARAIGIPIPASLTSAAPALPEFRAGFEAMKTAVAKKRLQNARSAQAGSSSSSMSGGGRMFVEDDGDNDYDMHDDGGGGGFGDDDDAGFDDAAAGYGAGEDEDGRAAARAALFGAGGEAATTADGSYPSGDAATHSWSAQHEAAAEADSYEALVLKHRDDFMAAAEEAVGRSAMAVRVAAWTDKMSKALEEEEARGAFDVHAYGGGVVSAMVAAGAAPVAEGEDGEGSTSTPVRFEDMLLQGATFRPPHQTADGGAVDEDDVDAGAGAGTGESGLGGSAPQVARSFLALLQLANAGSVELVHAGDEHTAASAAPAASTDGLFGHLGVRLLSSADPTAYLDRMADVAADAAALNGAAAAATNVVPPSPPETDAEETVADGSVVSATASTASTSTSVAASELTSKPSTKTKNKAKATKAGPSRRATRRSARAARAAAAADDDDDDDDGEEELDAEAYSDDEAGTSALARTRGPATPPASGGKGNKTSARIKGDTPGAKRSAPAEPRVALSLRQSLAVVGHDSDSDESGSDSDDAGHGIDEATMTAAASVVFRAAEMGLENGARPATAAAGTRGRSKRALAPLPQTVAASSRAAATKSPAPKRSGRRRAAAGDI